MTNHVLSSSSSSSSHDEKGVGAGGKTMIHDPQTDTGASHPSAFDDQGRCVHAKDPICLSSTKEESSIREYWDEYVADDRNLKQQHFLSSIEPLIKNLENKLQIDHDKQVEESLHYKCSSLQDENKCLKGEVEALKEFIYAMKVRSFIYAMKVRSSSHDQNKEDMEDLQKKIRALEAALRVEVLKREGLMKELEDARLALARRTRSKLKMGQRFEVVIAQKPQEVVLSSAATPVSDSNGVGSCPICLDDFDIASGWYMLNCGHRYHLLCLVQVMPTRTRCCVCNKDLHKLLYEVFGIGHRYPEDARLWDASTGQPVDFTMEEDIRAVINTIEESQEGDQLEGEESTQNEEQGGYVVSTQESVGGEGLELDTEEEEEEETDGSQSDETSQQDEDDSSEQQEEDEDDDEDHEDEVEEFHDTPSHQAEDDEDDSFLDSDASSTTNEDDDPNDPDYDPHNSP